MNSSTREKIALIGYAYGLGGTVPGCGQGPEVIRTRGLTSKLNDLGLDLHDLGNTSAEFSEEEALKVLDQLSPREQSINNAAKTLLACRQLYSLSQRALSEGMSPLIIGGDHSLSIASVAAVGDFYAQQNEAIGLIWIDTHADCNTPETSPSQNPFGMPISFLLGEVQGAFSKIQQHSPSILAEHLVYIGLRDVDRGEKEFIKRNNISAFTMKEIDRYGIGAVVEEAIEIASSSTAGFVTSFDLDVCDPRIVPGIGTPARGGLSFREAHLALELIHDSNKLLSFELVELNPALDRDSETADLAISLIESAFGKSIL